MNIDNASNIDNAQIKTEQLADMEKQITAYQKEKQILYEQLLTGKITLEEYKKLKQETDTKVENYRVQYNKCGDFSSLVLSDLRKPINA